MYFASMARTFLNRRVKRSSLMMNSALMKGIDNFKCQGGADDARAQHDHVHVVVLHALVCGVGIVAHAGANAGNLVGRDADAHARAADENAARGFAALDGQADALGKVGIVVLRLDFECAQVEDFMAGLSTDGREPLP